MFPELATLLLHVVKLAQVLAVDNVGKKRFDVEVESFQR